MVKTSRVNDLAGLLVACVLLAGALIIWPVTTKNSSGPHRVRAMLAIKQYYDKHRRLPLSAVEAQREFPLAEGTRELRLLGVDKGEATYSITVRFDGWPWATVRTTEFRVDLAKHP